MLIPKTRQKSFPIRLSDFTGGEAAIFPTLSTPPKYSMLLQNCHISEHGGIARIPGYTRVNSASCGVELRNGHEFVKTDGTKVILVAGGGKIFKVVGGALTEVKTGLNVAEKVRFMTMKNTVFAFNGVDAPIKSADGTTWVAAGAGIPATTFMGLVHKGRAWYISRANKLLANHSAINDPETAEGYIDFQYVLKKGDELLDMLTFIDLHIFVFRQHIAIYSGTTPSGTGSNYALVQLIEGSGAVSSDVTLGMGANGALLFDSGIISLKQVVSTGSLSVDTISKLIAPTIIEALNNASTFACAHYPKKGWILFLINTTVYIYSYIWKAWARMVGADVKGMFTTMDGTLYLCGTNYLYQYGTADTWTFDGTNSQMIWQTGWIPLSKDGIRIYPRMMEIVVYPHTLTSISLQYKYDMELSPSIQYHTIEVSPLNVTYIDAASDFDAINPFDEIQYKQKKVPLFGGGRSMQMIFSSTSNQPVEISDIALLAMKGNFN